MPMSPPGAVPFASFDAERPAGRAILKKPFVNGIAYEGDPALLPPVEQEDAIALAARQGVTCPHCGRVCKNPMGLLAHSRAHKPKKLKRAA